MGERDAEFAEFFALRFDEARRVAYARCGKWTDAEEIVRNAFVRVYARWATIRGTDAAADAYLRTVLTGSPDQAGAPDHEVDEPMPEAATTVEEVIRKGRRRMVAWRGALVTAVVAVVAVVVVYDVLNPAGVGSPATVPTPHWPTAPSTPPLPGWQAIKPVPPLPGGQCNIFNGSNSDPSPVSACLRRTSSRRCSSPRSLTRPENRRSWLRRTTSTGNPWPRRSDHHRDS